MLNQVFSLLIFFIVNKNYIDKKIWYNNLQYYNIIYKLWLTLDLSFLFYFIFLKLMHEDMYVYVVWVFLELQINIIVLPWPLQTKISGFTPVCMCAHASCIRTHTWGMRMHNPCMHTHACA